MADGHLEIWVLVVFYRDFNENFKSPAFCTSEDLRRGVDTPFPPSKRFTHHQKSDIRGRLL